MDQLSAQERIERRKKEREEREKRMAEEQAEHEAKLAALREKRRTDKQRRTAEIDDDADQMLKDIEQRRIEREEKKAQAPAPEPQKAQNGDQAREKELEEEKRRQEQQAEERKKKEAEEQQKKEAEEQRRREEEQAERQREEEKRKERDAEEKRKAEGQAQAEEARRKAEEESSRQRAAAAEAEAQKERANREAEQAKAPAASSAEAELSSIELRRKKREEAAEEKRRQLEEEKKKLDEEMERRRQERERAREARRKELSAASGAQEGQKEEEEEKKREEEEEKKKREEAEAEKRREQQRREEQEQEQEEKRRREEEEGQERRRKEEEERKRKEEQEEEERRRREEEEERRIKEEEASKRRHAEEEDAKKRAEDEERRKKAEQEEKRKEAEDEENRKKAEESEQKKLAEDEENRKKAHEEEQKRLEEEERQRLLKEKEVKREQPPPASAASDKLKELEEAEAKRKLERERRRKERQEKVAELTKHVEKLEDKTVHEEKKTRRAEASDEKKSSLLKSPSKEKLKREDSKGKLDSVPSISVSTEEPASAPKLTHLTKSRPSAPKRKSASVNPARHLQTLEQVEITQKLPEVKDDDEPKPKRNRPLSIAGVPMFGGAPGASTLEAAADREVAERKKFVPPKGSGPNLMAEAVGVKLRPSSFHASGSKTLDPRDLQANLKKKSSGLTELDKPFLMLKGKKRIHVCQIPKKSSYLNEGDVFILDTGLAIYVWNGSKAAQVKKAKALEVAHRIRDKEYGAKIDLHVLEGLDSSKHAAPFWKKLGELTKVKSAEEGGEDSEFEKFKDENTFLYCFGSEDGEKRLEAKGKEVSKQMLHSKEAVVLDSFSEIYIWIGRTCTDTARRAAEQFAKELSQEGNRPLDLIVATEESLKENTVFREKFSDWVEGGGSLSVKQHKNIEAKDKEYKVYDRGAYQKRLEKIDVDKMAYPEIIAKEKELFDVKHGGAGKLVKIWSCQDKEKHELDAIEAEDFFSKESYVFLFEFMQKNREGPGDRAVYVMYYWLGKDCKASDQGVSALLAVEIDKQYGAPQIRVPHGKEPSDFIAIFKSMMVVHNGTRAEFNPKTPALYDLRGSTRDAVKAEQTTMDASFLHSGHSFILSQPSKVFVWHGLGSFDFEEDAAVEVAESMAEGRAVVEFTEGKESDEFWKALGGRKEYCSNGLLKKDKRKQKGYKCRLFRCSFVKQGNPSAEEIENFCWSDLRQDGVFILDAYFELFVWVGDDTILNVKDLRLTMETALEYADLLKQKENRLGRNLTTLVFQKHEPVSFKGAFQAWQEPLLVKEEGVKERKVKIDKTPISLEVAWTKYIEATYPVEVLTGDEIPFGVDPAVLELYLDKESFEKRFGMSKEEFASLPKWKQTEKKKTSGLF